MKISALLKFVLLITTLVCLSSCGSDDSDNQTTNPSPVAENISPVATSVAVTTDEDKSVDITLQAMDKDGDSLIFVIVDQPRNGRVVILENIARYTPSEDFNGSDSFTFKANDGTDDSEMASITLTVSATADAPEAVDITTNTDKDISVEITLQASDADSDQLIYEIVSQPSNGTLGLMRLNKVNYTPNDNFIGSDNFMYRASDGGLSSIPAVVSVEVKPSLNTPPSVQPGSFETNMNQAILLNLLASDAEEDILNYKIIVQPTNGFLGKVDGNKVLYTPNDGFTGSDSFRFKTNDGLLDSNSSTITLSVSPLKRGKIIDSHIANLPYKVGNYEGLTDSEGYFKYNQDGEEIYFALGNIKLGSAKTQSVITTINVSKSKSALDAKNIELIQFLQTIDKDKDPSNGIDVDKGAHAYQHDGDIDFSNEDVNAVNVLTNLGWQSIEIVGKKAAINHFLESLSSSNDLQDYCEITSANVGAIFKQDTTNCLQRKYRDAYLNLVSPQISADANTVSHLINKTDSRREWSRQLVSKMLDAKKIYEYTRLIGASNVSELGKAALLKELAEQMVGASLGSVMGAEYADIWKKTIFSGISAFKAAGSGDPQAFTDIVGTSADLLWGAAVDFTEAWNANQLTEKANELQIVSHALVHYYDNQADQDEIMSTLELSGDFNWSSVVGAVASKNGFSNGIVSEDYDTDTVINMVHGYIKLIEKVTGEDFTYTNTVSESEALDAGSLYQSFLSSFSDSIKNGAIRNPISQEELDSYAKKYYGEAYLATRIYSESPDTEGQTKDQWTLSDYVCDDSGLIIGLYKRSGKEEYTLSFGGTTATCLKPGDGFLQSFMDTFFGVSLAYNLKETVLDIAADLFLFSDFPIKVNQAKPAINYLETPQLKSLLENGKITKITGHSLGGGLASYAGLYTGIETVTFNTAPLPFTTESLELFLTKGLVEINKVAPSGIVSEIDLVNKNQITNLMAVKDPVSLLSLELTALQKYANVNPVLNKWYLDPIKALMFVRSERQLNYLIQGEQIFLPVDYGSIGANHSVVNLLETFSQYIGDLDQDGVLDPFDDFPNDPLYYLDSDNDGLPNEWELEHSLDPAGEDNSLEDGDMDGLSNLGEYINKTSPDKPDSDDDQIPDGWEVLNRLNPLTNDATADDDDDNISNYQEYLDGTDPKDPEDYFTPSATGEFRVISQSVTPLSIQLSWEAVDQAENYLICYTTTSMDNMPNNQLDDCTLYENAKWLSSLQGTSITITDNLAADQTYYFRMAALRDGKVGNISEQISVTLDRDSQVNLNQGLVAHYAFEENGNDSSDNQFDATETNVSYIDGVQGKAAHMPDGNGLLMASHDWPEFQNFTISMYIKLDKYALDAVSSTTARNVFLSFDYQTPGLENALELALEAYYSNEPENMNLSVRIAASRDLHSNKVPAEFMKDWASVVYTREGGVLKVYVNGHLFHSYNSPSSVALRSSHLVIGQDYPLLDRGLALYGAIDELKIYNRAVSISEIKQLSKETIASLPPTSKLNDTGIIMCGDENLNDLPCPVSGHPNQDAEYGRDVTNNDYTDGHAGFSFTKLDSEGNELSASAAIWSCVKDNITGLVWEVKKGGNRTIGDEGLHDADDRYTWYNTDTNNNGGHAGYQQNNEFGGAYCAGYDSSVEGSYCNTQAFINRVNDKSLCGTASWRLPSREELHSITNFNVGRDDSGSVSLPALDSAYFSGAVREWYLTSTPTPRGSSSVWVIDSGQGLIQQSYKSRSHAVRLVHD